jgi:hypothetical protein
MDHIIAFDAAVETVYRTLTHREYWQTLLETYRHLTPLSEITEFRSDERGTDIVVTHTLARRHLPPIVRTVMPVDMIVTRRQHFDPYDHAGNRAQGRFGGSVAHWPAKVGGQYVVTATHTGGQMLLTSECNVSIPLIGGTLEDLILHHMKQLFDAEEAFTANWIAKHR